MQSKSALLCVGQRKMFGMDTGAGSNADANADGNADRSEELLLL